jgi:hypothetical protein
MGNGYAPIAILIFLAFFPERKLGFRKARLRLELFPLIKCPAKDFLKRTLPRAVIFTLFLSPLWVFILGIGTPRLRLQNANTTVYDAFSPLQGGGWPTSSGGGGAIACEGHEAGHRAVRWCEVIASPDPKNLGHPPRRKCHEPASTTPSASPAGRSRSDRGAASRAVLMPACRLPAACLTVVRAGRADRRVYRTLRLRGLGPTKTIADALKTYLTTGQWPPLPPAARVPEAGEHIPARIPAASTRSL